MIACLDIKFDFVKRNNFIKVTIVNCHRHSTSSELIGLICYFTFTLSALPQHLLIKNSFASVSDMHRRFSQKSFNYKHSLRNKRQKKGLLIPRKDATMHKIIGCIEYHQKALIKDRIFSRCFYFLVASISVSQSMIVYF